MEAGRRRTGQPAARAVTLPALIAVAGRIDAANLRGSAGGTNGTIVNNGTNATVTQFTNSAGQYAALFLLPGAYATSLLVGLGANALLGWWWADPLAAFDTLKSLTVLYGGVSQSGTTLDELWMWNGSSWTTGAVNASCTVSFSFTINAAASINVALAANGGVATASSLGRIVTR